MTNIAEILKNAPQGLELYSPIFGNVKLNEINISDDYPINIYYNDKYSINNSDCFDEEGKRFKDIDDTECVLFPSKGHKSWDNWQKVLFQRGDVIVSIDEVPVLYYEDKGSEYSVYNKYGEKCGKTLSYLFNCRYATPEEREQFFKELNANGYKWNADTKQIEKIEQTIEKYYTPKYKIGDWVESLGIGTTQIIGITNNCYNFSNNKLCNIFAFDNDTSSCLAETPLKEKTFTIDDLKPFDKVLVRDSSGVTTWQCELFQYYNNENKYQCFKSTWWQCIPYNNETKHLLGTTDDAPDKYKTW